MTALPNKHYTEHHKATETEEDQKTPGNKVGERHQFSSTARER